MNVLSNSYPDFETTLQTNWMLIAGPDQASNTTTYTIPALVDPQGNDEPDMYLTQTVDEENGGYRLYPDQFMTYDNATRTLSWIPDSEWY